MAPEAVMVAWLPSQILGFVVVITGLARVEITMLPVAEQLFASVPVTEYVLVEVGDTVIVVPEAPVLHV